MSQNFSWQSMVCPFCKNTGKHLSPEAAEPVVVNCERKGCPYGRIAELERERDELRARCDKLDASVERQLLVCAERIDTLTEALRLIADFNMGKTNLEDDIIDIKNAARAALAKAGVE